MSDSAEPPDESDIRFRIEPTTAEWRERHPPDSLVSERANRLMSRKVAKLRIESVSGLLSDGESENPDEFKRIPELEALLWERFASISSEQGEDFKKVIQTGIFTDGARAKKLIRDRIRTEGPGFAGALLKHRIIWNSEDFDDVLISILSDEAIEFPIVTKAAAQLRNSETAFADLIQLLDLPEKEASNTAWALAGSENPKLLEALLSRAKEGLNRLRIRRDDDFRAIENWINTLLCLVEDRNKVASADVREEAQKLIGATLKKARLEQAARFSDWTLRDLSKLTPKEALNLFEMAWEHYGWEDKNRAVTILEALLRAAPGRFLDIPLKGLESWPAFRPLYALDDEEARHTVDCEMLNRIEASEKPLKRRAELHYLIAKALPRHRQKVFNYLRERPADDHSMITRFAWFTWNIGAEDFWKGLQAAGLAPESAETPDFGFFDLFWKTDSTDPFYHLWDPLGKSGVACVESYDSDEVPPPYTKILRELRRIARGHFDIDRIRTRWRERSGGRYDGWFEVSFTLKDQLFRFDIRNSGDDLLAEYFLRGVNGALSAVGEPGRFIQWTGDSLFFICVFGDLDRWADFAREFFLLMKYPTVGGTTIVLQTYDALLESVSEPLYEDDDFDSW